MLLFEAKGTINVAPNHPAARLTKSSERIIKTRFTKIMISQKGDYLFDLLGLFSDNLKAIYIKNTTIITKERAISPIAFAVQKLLIF